MASCKSDATSPDAEIVENLINMDEIQKAFEKLCSEEESLNENLTELIDHQSSLEEKMLGLHRTLPNLHMLQTDSKQLSSMVTFTSTLAENVSSKVRQLDLAKNRVTACIESVEDILDLKYCTDGVQQALHNEDYEKAAGHIHRFRSIDENVLRMSEIASEGGSLDSSFKLLHESEEKLRVIVNNKFDASVHTRDVASIERFFKIFPLLGMHEEGLTKFGKYLAAKSTTALPLAMFLLLVLMSVDVVSGSLEHFKDLPDFVDHACLSDSLFTHNAVKVLQCVSFCQIHGSDCKGVSFNMNTGQCLGCSADSFQNLDTDSEADAFIYKRVTPCIDEHSPDDANTIPAVSLISFSLICPTVILTVDNGYIGTWYTPSFCEVGTYAMGFNVKNEVSQGMGDDSALNAVELSCKSIDHSVPGGYISSQIGEFGDWLTYVDCDPGHVLKSYRIRVETRHEHGDNGGQCNIEFKCGEFFTNADMNIVSIDVGNSWGDWGSWSETCGPGQGICGIRVRILPHNPPEDATSLNDVVTYCC